MAGFQHFPEGVRHVHRLRVRYADTDRMDMVYHENDLLVTGDVVLVFVDAPSGRPCRPPAGLAEKMHELGLIAT